MTINQSDRKPNGYQSLHTAASDRDGWKEAAIAWEVCASIHYEYAKGKDAVFKTRQADFVRHAEDARQTYFAGAALPHASEDHTVVIAALERLITAEKLRDERLRAEHPRNPYINLMQMEDVEQLEEAVKIIRALGAASVEAPTVLRGYETVPLESGGSVLKSTTLELPTASVKGPGATADQFDREDVEAVADCLGDDAAQLRQENDEDERADNMDRAASMLTWMLLTHSAYASGVPASDPDCFIGGAAGEATYAAAQVEAPSHMRSTPRALFIDLDSYLRHIESFGSDDQKRMAEAVRKTVEPHLAGVLASSEGRQP